MTEEEARNFLVEDELRQAKHTIEFLHNCLTRPGFSYEYPEMTERHLEDIENLIGTDPIRDCFHGVYKTGCEGCEAHRLWYVKRQEARNVLGL